MQPFAVRGDDLYETPPEAVRALLKVESFSSAILEPACGRSGNIVRVLREAGHKVIATDLVNYPFEFPEASGGIDFLMERHAPAGVETIITNPPFMHADDFVRHALELVPRVVMILRLAYLESQRRSDILDDGRLARVYPFANRVRFFRDGCKEQENGSGAAIAFAWFVWERDHRGPWEGRRISWEVLPADADSLRRAAP
jgi:hypothetical protein